MSGTGALPLKLIQMAEHFKKRHHPPPHPKKTNPNNNTHPTTTHTQQQERKQETINVCLLLKWCDCTCTHANSVSTFLLSTGISTKGNCGSFSREGQMHQSHYSAYITYETGGISTSYCPSIFLSSAVTQLWHKGPQCLNFNVGASLPQFQRGSRNALNFNGGTSMPCFNVKASVPQFQYGGLNFNFNVGTSVSMWGPQCLHFNMGGLNFNTGASISMWGPQFQCLSFNVGGLNFNVERTPKKMLLVKMRGTEVEQQLLKSQVQYWCRIKPLVRQGIFLPESTSSTDSLTVPVQPVCYRMHQHLRAR